MVRVAVSHAGSTIKLKQSQTQGHIEVHGLGIRFFRFDTQLLTLSLLAIC